MNVIEYSNMYTFTNVNTINLCIQCLCMDINRKNNVVLESTIKIDNIRQDKKNNR